MLRHVILRCPLLFRIRAGQLTRLLVCDNGDCLPCLSPALHERRGPVPFQRYFPMSSRVSTFRALRPPIASCVADAVRPWRAVWSVAGQQQTAVQERREHGRGLHHGDRLDRPAGAGPHQDDFEIYDNGKLQPITLFATETQPHHRHRDARPQRQHEGELQPRRGRRRGVRQAAAAGRQGAHRQLRDEDQIDPEEFTSDRKTLIDILRSELAARRTDAALERRQRRRCGSSPPQDGRKVVLLFTDGVDSPGNFKTNNLSVMDVMERATQGRRDDLRDRPREPAALRPAAGADRRRRLQRRVRRQGGGGMTQRPDPGLPKIAAETGGGYFELTRADDLQSTFARVADELHQQYTLGFAADQARWQDARPRGQGQDEGDESAGAQELPRGKAADVLDAFSLRPPTSRRRCFVLARRRLASRRCSLDAPDGRVLRRRFGLTVA